MIEQSQTPKYGKLVRPKNESVREREHLRPDEMESLIKAAGAVGRYGHRDAILLLLIYRHGLRVSEAIALQWQQVDFKTSHIYINRNKNGNPSNQPILGDELRALRKLQRDYPDSSYLFVTERKGPLTDHTVRKLVTRAGISANLGFPVHPHMLRHATGYYLASRGVDTRTIQDSLGHKQIQHTVRYTKLAPGRFDELWKG